MPAWEFSALNRQRERNSNEMHFFLTSLWNKGKIYILLLNNYNAESSNCYIWRPFLGVIFSYAEYPPSCGLPWQARRILDTTITEARVCQQIHSSTSSWSWKDNIWLLKNLTFTHQMLFFFKRTMEIQGVKPSFPWERVRLLGSLEILLSGA